MTPEPVSLRRRSPLQRLAGILTPVLLTGTIVGLAYLGSALVEEPLDALLTDESDANIPETVFFVLLAALMLAVVGLHGPEIWSQRFALGRLAVDRVMLEAFGLTALLFVFERLTIAAGLYGTSVGTSARVFEESTLLGVVNSVVLAPVIEEMLFRGYLFTALRPVQGPAVSIAISAVAFALYHLENGFLFALFVLPTGLLLGYVRERSGNIALPLLIHALMNGIVSVLWLARTLAAAP